MFVGASNVPSVVRANALVVALCSTVSAIGDTTHQLPAPRRVRAAIWFAALLIKTASAACSSPTKTEPEPDEQYSQKEFFTNQVCGLID